MRSSAGSPPPETDVVTSAPSATAMLVTARDVPNPRPPTRRRAAAGADDGAARRARVAARGARGLSLIHSGA